MTYGTYSTIVYSITQFVIKYHMAFIVNSLFTLAVYDKLFFSHTVNFDGSSFGRHLKIFILFSAKLISIRQDLLISSINKKNVYIPSSYITDELKNFHHLAFSKMKEVFNLYLRLTLGL